MCCLTDSKQLRLISVCNVSRLSLQLNWKIKSVRRNNGADNYNLKLLDTSPHIKMTFNAPCNPQFVTCSLTPHLVEQSYLISQLLQKLHITRSLITSVFHQCTSSPNTQSWVSIFLDDI